MKIDPLSAGRSGATRKSERGGASGASGAFARQLAGEPARGAPATAGPAQLGRIDAILALQEVPDPTDRRRRAVRRGEELLDQLDRLRLGLLDGSVSKADLERLAANLAGRSEQVADERLAEVLAEIELRVAVELAKLER